MSKATEAAAKRAATTPTTEVPAGITYRDWVAPRGTFLGDYARENGDFDSFANFRGVLKEVWTSAIKKGGKGGHKIARVISNTDEKKLHNLPAGLFTAFVEDNPGQQLVLVTGTGDDRKWAINPAITWSYDVEKGIIL